MSTFSSMHDRYLDHGNPMNEADNWGLDLDLLMKELKGWDTGRWDWDQIDICLTGKDADLEPWGQQGFGIVSLDDDGVTIRVHGYKTEPGDDVCLNFPKNLDESNDEIYDKYREIYLEQAYHIVCGAGSVGEWDGDSWGLSFEEEIIVPWALTRKLGKPSYIRTARAIVVAANKAIKPWEDEMILMSEFTDQLAGWRNGKNERCPEGEPDMGCSIFNPIYMDES